MRMSPSQVQVTGAVVISSSNPRLTPLRCDHPASIYLSIYECMSPSFLFSPISSSLTSHPCSVVYGGLGGAAPRRQLLLPVADQRRILRFPRRQPPLVRRPRRRRLLLHRDRPRLHLHALDERRHQRLRLRPPDVDATSGAAGPCRQDLLQWPPPSTSRSWSAGNPGCTPFQFKQTALCGSRRSQYFSHLIASFPHCKQLSQLDELIMFFALQ